MKKFFLFNIFFVVASSFCFDACASSVKKSKKNEFNIFRSCVNPFAGFGKNLVDYGSYVIPATLGLIAVSQPKSLFNFPNPIRLGWKKMKKSLTCAFCISGILFWNQLRSNNKGFVNAQRDRDKKYKNLKCKLDEANKKLDELQEFNKEIQSRLYGNTLILKGISRKVEQNGKGIIKVEKQVGIANDTLKKLMGGMGNQEKLLEEMKKKMEVSAGAQAVLLSGQKNMDKKLDEIINGQEEINENFNLEIGKVLSGQGSQLSKINAMQQVLVKNYVGKNLYPNSPNLNSDNLIEHPSY